MLLGPGHVHFMDAYPEIREFMEQVNKDRDHTKVEEKQTAKYTVSQDLPNIERLQRKKKDDPY